MTFQRVKLHACSESIPVKKKREKKGKARAKTAKRKVGYAKDMQIE